MKTLLFASVLLAMRMFADVSWTGADSGDIASGGNWGGNSVPVFNESTSTGEAAVFYGKGECTVPLTMGSSLYINSFLFISDTSARYGTTWDMDLAEKTLRLYGDYDFHGDHALYLFGNNQKIFFRNGILDFAGAYPNTIMMVMVQGSGSELVFQGDSLTLSGCPSFRCFNEGTLMFTNGVNATGYFTSSRGGLIRIAGEGTVIDSGGIASSLGGEQGRAAGRFELLDNAEWKNAVVAVMGTSGYGGEMLVSNATLSVNATSFGVGTGVYASNNVLRVTGGSKVSVNTATPVNKGCIGVGNGFNNLLEISGAYTEFTANGLADNSSSIVRVGEQGYFNTFRVTDSAKVSFSSGTLTVGPNENGVFRCDSIGNKVRVDGGAALSVYQAAVGSVMNRSDYLNFCHRDFNGKYVLDNADTYLHSSSNVIEVSGTGSRFTVSGGLSVAAQESLRYDADVSGNGVSVDDGASLSANLIKVGARGHGNFLTVGSGASVTSLCQITVGGVSSYDTAIDVRGGELRVKNDYYYFTMAGSADSSMPTCLSVSDGGKVHSYYFKMTGDNNRLSISNGTVTATAGLYFSDEGSGASQTFEFAGTNSVLKMNAAANDFLFRENTKFIFRIPAGGYSAVPIQGGNNITISGNPTVELDLTGYFRGDAPRTTVIAQAGARGVLSVSESALDSLNGSAKKYNCGIKLSDDNKKLVLVYNPGFSITIR